MLILFYNSFFGSTPKVVECGARHSFTSDRRRMPEADAVIFHLPDALFAGDARKYPGQQWVAWSMESTINTPLLDRPDIMRHFDLKMTFSRSSDVWCPYLPQLGEWTQALSQPLQTRRHSSPVVMFQSATIDRCGRNAFCAELMKHIPVDSYGRFLKNRELEETDRGYETKRAVIGGYKFALGAENTMEADYVTEKFFQPLLAGTVPVYRGAPNIEDFAPGDNCYVDATAFSSPAQLADYLAYLSRDDAAYSKYLEWRTQPLRPSFLQKLEQCETEAFCRLAELLERRPRPAEGAVRFPFGIGRYIETKARRISRALRGAAAAIANR